MDIICAKKQLRQRMLKRRNGIAANQRTALGQAISKRVLGLVETTKAKTIFCYVSMASEVPTRLLIAQLLDLGKTVALPKITDDSAKTMTAVPITHMDNLIKNQLGTYEPAGNSSAADIHIAPENFDLVLAPGTAFTLTGQRLGMGAGFYDRYLAKHKPACAVGLCFEKQLVQQIPTTPSDMKMDMLVTEKRVVKC